MSFRWKYKGIYDQETLEQLQEVFDALWLITADAGMSLGRDDVMRMIVEAHGAGMSPAQIRQHLIYEVFGKTKHDR